MPRPKNGEERGEGGREWKGALGDATGNQLCQDDEQQAVEEGCVAGTPAEAGPKGLPPLRGALPLVPTSAQSIPLIPSAPVVPVRNPIFKIRNRLCNGLTSDDP